MVAVGHSTHVGGEGAVTVREMVRAMQRDMVAGPLEPEQARTICTRLQGLSWNCFEEIQEAEEAYNLVLLKHLDGGEAVNKATIRAQTTDEYKRLQIAKHTHKFVSESVLSLRKVLSSLDTEMRLA